MRGPAIDPVKAAEAMNLGDAGYAKNDIARRTGLARSSVDDILNRVGHWGEIADRPVFVRMRQEQNQVLEAGWRTGVAKCLAKAFEDDRLDKMSSYQLVGMAGICTQNSQLLSGAATQIVEVQSKALAVGLDKFCSLLSQSLLSTTDVTPSQTAEDATIIK